MQNSPPLHFATSMWLACALTQTHPHTNTHEHAHKHTLHISINSCIYHISIYMYAVAVNTFSKARTAGIPNNWQFLGPVDWKALSLS